MTRFTVRRRWSGDLAGCERALAAVHRADGYPVVWPEHPTDWLADSDQLAAWVAVAPDGTVVGHAALSSGSGSSAGAAWARRSGGAAEETGAVSRLFVDPGARGHRLGARLLDSVVQQARSWLLLPVLDVVTANTAAVRLYQQQGWERLLTEDQHWSNGMTVAVHCFALTAADDGR